MNRPSQWNDAVYTLIVKAMARVGWWLQRPLIKLQREAMTTVNVFDDAEQSDSPVSQPCAHERVTEPKYGGGNYGFYGYVRCLDCGAWKDDYSDWHAPRERLDESARVGFDDGPMLSKACAARMHEFCSYEGLGCGCECHKRQDAAVDEYLDDLDERLGLRTLDVSTDEIKKWPTIRPSQWTDEQTEHVESITRGIRPEILKPNVHERLEQWRTGQIELQGTEPQWYQDNINAENKRRRLINEAQCTCGGFLEGRHLGTCAFAPVTLEQLGEWERQRELERIERRRRLINEQRERLKQPHMGDELSDEEVNEYLEHGNLPHEAERLAEIAQSRARREELMQQVSEQPSTASIMARLEQARLEHEAERETAFQHYSDQVDANLERASTMPPEAPQEPVSAAEPEDEWKCLHCGQHVERTAEQSRYKREFSNVVHGYVTTQAWCNQQHYEAWKATIGADAPTQVWRDSQ